jgi:hypothetical protein
MGNTFPCFSPIEPELARDSRRSFEAGESANTIRSDRGENGVGFGVRLSDVFPSLIG